MILEDNITIKITKQNIDYFKSLNYDCELKKTIIIKVTDLQKYSQKKINVKCDICGSESMLSYRNYNKNYNKYNIYS